MRFVDTAIPGVVVLEIEPHQDERGFFARSWCDTEARARGMRFATRQCSISYNRRRGTLRGMHYQIAPREEAKLVRCTAGAIFDVAVDLRTGSRTYGQHVSVELSAENRRMLFVPEGCAHGFLTLTAAAEVFYQISEEYSPQHSRGVRWDDPFFRIPWPQAVEVISERDRTYSDFVPEESGHLFAAGPDARPEQCP